MPALPSLKEQDTNPFELFFQDPIYLEFKNHLYNYHRRKEEIRCVLKDREEGGMVLEIGSGVSPIAEGSREVIFSDLSKEAMRYLTKRGLAERALAMSASEIAFKDESVSAIVCSEVLEHIKEDEKALAEMARVLKPGGTLVVTVPVHSYYFAWDDDFVKHQRRYSLTALTFELEKLGFKDFKISKVTGFLDKITMIVAVTLFNVLGPWLKKHQKTSANVPAQHPWLKAILPAYKAINKLYSYVVKWEAKIMPFFVTTIVLISCKKLSSKR